MMLVECNLVECSHLLLQFMRMKPFWLSCSRSNKIVRVIGLLKDIKRLKMALQFGN